MNYHKFVVTKTTEIQLDNDKYDYKAYMYMVTSLILATTINSQYKLQCIRSHNICTCNT